MIYHKFLGTSNVELRVLKLLTLSLSLCADEAGAQHDL